MPSPNQNDDLSSIIKDFHHVYTYQQEKDRGDTNKKYTLIMVKTRKKTLSNQPASVIFNVLCLLDPCFFASQS